MEIKQLGEIAKTAMASVNKIDGWLIHSTLQEAVLRDYRLSEKWTDYVAKERLGTLHLDFPDRGKGVQAFQVITAQELEEAEYARTTKDGTYFIPDRGPEFAQYARYCFDEIKKMDASATLDPLSKDLPTGKSDLSAIKKTVTEKYKSKA